MLELSLSRLGGIAGGCYCYCFKYPVRHRNMLNPTILIGERSDEDSCEEDCYPKKEEISNYLGYSDCIDYIRVETIPTQRFWERAARLDEIDRRYGGSGSI